MQKYNPFFTQLSKFTIGLSERDSNTGVLEIWKILKNNYFEEHASRFKPLFPFFSFREILLVSFMVLERIYIWTSIILWGSLL